MNSRLFKMLVRLTITPSTKAASVVALVSVLVFSPSVLAEVFKCVDKATGKMTFTDIACPDKGTGDYVPVKPANGDSGYPTANEIDESQRQNDQSMRARHAELDQRAADRDQEKRIAAHQKKVDQLYDQAEREKDPVDRSSLLRQAKSEQEAVSAAERGGATAEEHYKKAGEYFEEARRAKDLNDHSAMTRRALGEQDAGSAAAGLPTPTEPSPDPSAPIPGPTHAPQPSVITNCDTAGCWDNVGNRYNHGAGQTFFRSDGKTCQGVGGNMQCN